MRFHRRETCTIRYTTSTADEVRCHLWNGGGRGRSRGSPRPQSRTPETTTLIVMNVRIASDAKRRTSRSTRGPSRMSWASIRAIRWRRCARWTMTRPANTSPTSACMALRTCSSCRVPNAAAKETRRPRCTSQRDLARHEIRDRTGPRVGAPTARPCPSPEFTVSMDFAFQSGCSGPRSAFSASRGSGAASRQRQTRRYQRRLSFGRVL